MDEESYAELFPISKTLGKENFSITSMTKQSYLGKLGVQTNLAGDDEAQLMGLGNVHRGIFISNAWIVDTGCIAKFCEYSF